MKTNYISAQTLFTLFLPAIVTSACRGYPTATPMPLASIITSKLSSPSTIVSFTIGMDTVTSVSPGKIITLIGVLSKSSTKGVTGSVCTKIDLSSYQKHPLVFALSAV